MKSFRDEVITIEEVATETDIKKCLFFLLLGF